MNNQEAFNKAVIGVVAQGGPASNGNARTCFYRHVSGRKCAVGHLIPDSEYREMFEGNPVQYVRPDVPSLFGVSLLMLEVLQHAHDGMLGDSDLQSFINISKRFAEEHHLTFPEAEVQALLDQSNTNVQKAS